MGLLEKYSFRKSYAHVAQLDRVPGYEPGGRRFESFHARQIKKPRLWRGFLFVVLIRKNFKKPLINA